MKLSNSLAEFGDNGLSHISVEMQVLILTEVGTKEWAL
jgi:hypothetical protein